MDITLYRTIKVDDKAIKETFEFKDIASKHQRVPIMDLARDFVFKTKTSQHESSLPPCPDPPPPPKEIHKAEKVSDIMFCVELLEGNGNPRGRFAGDKGGAAGTLGFNVEFAQAYRFADEESAERFKEFMRTHYDEEFLVTEHKYI